MRYLQLIRVAPDAEPGSDEDPTAWVEDTTRRGIRLRGDRLRPEDDATTVRRHDGATLVTDGPFAEAREQIGGFDLLEAADLAEAVAVAAAHPVTRFGAIELRAVAPFGDPELDAAGPPEAADAPAPAGWHTYVLLMGVDGDAPGPDFDDPATQEAWRTPLREWIADGRRRGLLIDGAALTGPEQATTVRVQDGRTVVVDGPFAEAREHVGGYQVIQAPSLDDAIELAATHPASAVGPIEIRPVWPM
ncbi:YciI family protein [Pengzhenrongella sicca]|uniref:YCII-related domain-containing protein n=1 Tax=Pengzhenrongella sicca TaxID=2819238 RepID=A0A8A4ZC36_9MICO|nr:YciI family protein [Pengzhenrongella sicca]QTE28156.1 hypothetical protein J4E96_12230 [Pengzhenrongella sicca]